MECPLDLEAGISLEKRVLTEANVNWLLAGRETANAGCGQAELSESSYRVAKADKAFPVQLGDLALRVAFVDLAQGIEFVWS
jgi:hypothetical protein